MSSVKVGTKGVPRSEREAQILDVAAREFGTEGYAATSIQTVAELAGISKPLVYQYFGSKEGLHAACLDRAGDLVGGEIERVARGETVGLLRGLVTLEAMFTVLEERRHVWRLLNDPTAPTAGPVAVIVRRHVGRLTQLAEEGVTELLALAGIDDVLDISALTATWIGIVDSLMDWWVDHPEVDAAAMVQRCVRLMSALFTDAVKEGL